VHTLVALLNDKFTPTLTMILQALMDKLRTAAATPRGRSLNFSMSIVAHRLVDRIDNCVGRVYTCCPNRMVIVGSDVSLD